jgi:hypothetical protein
VSKREKAKRQAKYEKKVALKDNVTFDDLINLAVKNEMPKAKEDKKTR